MGPYEKRDNSMLIKKEKKKRKHTKESRVDQLKHVMQCNVTGDRFTERKGN